jgi:hypothetical protein
MAVESIVVCSCWKAHIIQVELDHMLKAILNNPAAKKAIRQLQRAFRRFRMQKARERLKLKQPKYKPKPIAPRLVRLSIGPDEIAEAHRSIGPEAGLADVAYLALAMSEPSDRWAPRLPRLHPTAPRPAARNNPWGAKRG